jgi:thymidylate synthase
MYEYTTNYLWICYQLIVHDTVITHLYHDIIENVAIQRDRFKKCFEKLIWKQETQKLRTLRNQMHFNICRLFIFCRTSSI